MSSLIPTFRQRRHDQAVREPGERDAERRDVRDDDRRDALPDELLDRRVEADQEVSAPGRGRHHRTTLRRPKRRPFSNVAQR